MSTLPIRVREIVRADGSRTRSLHVHCPRERASVAPERCARCGFRCPPEDGKFAPAVGCAVEDPEPANAASRPLSLVRGTDAAASRVPAGAASEQVVVCILADAPLGVVHRTITSAGRRLAFPVVDASGALLGSLSGAAVIAAGEDPRAEILPASEAMLAAISVHESAPLDGAIATMASHHLRHLPIVDDAKRVTGVLSDLEVLRWIARGAPTQWW